MDEDKKTQLKNADVNLSQYGDDSSAPNQTTAGGMNEKYTGEGVKTSNVAYDPNAKTSTLDPNYKYGYEAQLENSKDSGYIARRNDNIASALYNEGKTTKDDVVQYLGSQNNWNNSTEADRVNTVESVYKRLGEVSTQQGDKTEETTTEETATTEEPQGEDVDVNTFLKGSTTELFGKMITGADTAPYDHNSNEWLQAESRMNKYQQVNSMSVSDIANAITSGSILSGSQVMKDLQTYNPEKYSQLQEYQEQEKILDQVNTYSTGSSSSSTSTLTSQTNDSINNYLNETVSNAGYDSSARDDLDNTLSSSSSLINYAERMSYYSTEIEKLDNTISDLESDARKTLSKSLGENVPEYMIQNYVSNRSAKLYKQRDKLTSQYNYYKGVYEAQVEQEATEWERNYKERQLELQEAELEWDKKMDINNLNYNYSKLNQSSDSTTNGTGTGTMRTERNNNPTAMTTDVAKSLGLVEGVDYVQGDPFVTGSGTTLYTAKLLGDPVETTIKAFDTAIANGKSAFYTQSGGQRRTHTAMTNAQWSALDDEGKRNVVLNMLQREGGDITKMSYYNQSTNDGNYTKLKNGTMTYSEFIKKYNGDISQDEKNQYIISQAMKDVNSADDFIDTFNWLRKVSSSQFYEGDMASNTKYDMLTALADGNKSSQDIMKLVNSLNDQMGGNDEDLIDSLAIALSGRYTSEDALDTDLDIIGKKDKRYTSSTAKKIWNEWKDSGVL